MPRSHQLVVLRRKLKGRARLTNNDRWFLVQLYRWFPSILPALMIIRLSGLSCGMTPWACERLRAVRQQNAVAHLCCYSSAFALRIPRLEGERFLSAQPDDVPRRLPPAIGCRLQCRYRSDASSFQIGAGARHWPSSDRSASASNTACFAPRRVPT
jgi:hypothetical protein